MTPVESAASVDSAAFDGTLEEGKVISLADPLSTQIGQARTETPLPDDAEHSLTPL